MFDFWRVDFDLFPALVNVDYHTANLTSGDCLFIPSNWIFQERSLENTIAVIYNIRHQHALNIDINELKTCPDYDGTFTLDQIDWSNEHQPQSFKWNLFFENYMLSYFSNKVVNIIINVHFCSQIILQKASQVVGNGPWVAI